MPKSPGRNSRSETAYCTACKEEFLTYNTVASTECPFCGRRVRPAGQKRVLCFIALGLVFSVAAAGAVALWLRR